MLKFCPFCSMKFDDNGNPFKMYCCRDHSKKAAHNKERSLRTAKEREVREKICCGICGKLFISSRQYKIYCSEECRKRANKEHKKKENARRRPTKPITRICKWCGKDFEAIGKRKCCSDEHSYLYLYGRELPKEIIRECEWCGKEFKTRHSKSRCCCKKHTNRMNKYERAQRKRVAVHLSYSRFKIFQRDNFVCHICGEPIDMSAVAPANFSPTIDHVIPIRLGGADIPDNVKAAHFICNSIKGARLLQ